MLNGIAVGQQLPRRRVHEMFGGRQQGGIGPSRQAPVVLFFTDPATGHKHGYYDGWDDDGLFNYVGEGQVGDQRLAQGNKAINDHAKEGRSLEGFVAQGTMVTYLGEFALVDHYWAEAHESGDPTKLRQVVVFRLRPVDAEATRAIPLPRVPITRASLPRVERVAVEEQHTERAFVTPDREPYELERREAALVNKYREHLRRLGHDVSRLQVVPPGETAPLYSDLWDETAQELIEAKGIGTRNELRMAVGQLFDYGRFVPHQRKAVLLPGRPRADLLAYLDSVGVAAVFPEGDDFVRVG